MGDIKDWNLSKAGYMLYHSNRIPCFVTRLCLCDQASILSLPAKPPLALSSCSIPSPPVFYINNTYWSLRSSISLRIATRIESHLEELKAMLHWMLSHASSHSFWLLNMVLFPILAAKHGVAFHLLCTQQGNCARPIYTSRKALAGLFHSKYNFQLLPHLLKGGKKSLLCHCRFLVEKINTSWTEASY